MPFAKLTFMNTFSCQIEIIDRYHLLAIALSEKHANFTVEFLNVLYEPDLGYKITDLRSQRSYTIGCIRSKNLEKQDRTTTFYTTRQTTFPRNCYRER